MPSRISTRRVTSSIIPCLSLLTILVWIEASVIFSLWPGETWPGHGRRNRSRSIAGSCRVTSKTLSGLYRPKWHRTPLLVLPAHPVLCPSSERKPRCCWCRWAQKQRGIAALSPWFSSPLWDLISFLALRVGTGSIYALALLLILGDCLCRMIDIWPDQWPAALRLSALTQMTLNKATPPGLHVKETLWLRKSSQGVH